MKKFMILLLTVMLIAGSPVAGYASDWDVAGKILTGIEGMRLITGGKVDVVGAIIGGGGSERGEYASKGYRHDQRYKKRHHHHADCTERVWVPHYEWRKKHIPEHEEYDDHLGKVIVEGHYVKYQVQDGGYWEEKYNCGY